MEKSEQHIGILAKLMDENVEISDIRKQYGVLCKLVGEQLPDELDKGMYTVNAGIMQKIEQTMKQYDFFTVVPDIIGKSILAFYGNGNLIVSNVLDKLQTKSGLTMVANNVNLPLIITSRKGIEKDKIYAVTYMNKLVELDDEEYFSLTDELRKNMDIKKLIKCFLIQSEYKYSNLAFIILPRYTDIKSDVINAIKNVINKFYIVQDKGGKWKKLYRKLDNKNITICTNKKNLIEINPDNQDADVEWINFYSLQQEFNEHDKISINYIIKTELQEILLDVDVFYNNQIQHLENNIELLAQDSIRLVDEKIKEKIKDYRSGEIEKKEKFERCKRQFDELYKKIEDTASICEKQIGGIPSKAQECNAEKYIDYLSKIFFKHIYANQIEDAREDIKKLGAVNYKYGSAFRTMVKYEKGIDLTFAEIEALNRNIDRWEILKIKIELSSVLGLSEEVTKSMISKIKMYNTGKEWYLFGWVYIEKKDFINAKKCFFNALDKGYSKAGEELIDFSQKYPEMNINIDELAENLVPAANYYVGNQNIESQYKKAIINLKIAAAKGNTKAIEMIADILFEKYKEFSLYKMEKEENKNKVRNVINLYEYLNQQEEKQKYKLNMGLLYCKLKDYSRAQSLLKNINTPEAQYECAKMYQYGDGVAKNLKKAKKYYENIDKSYKDVKEQYDKVCKQLEEIKKKKEEQQNADYSGSTSTSYEGSSFCFITTAACMALHEKKDCKELNELRKFRDEHLLTTGDEDKKLVQEYYRIGPLIVEKIDAEWNPFAIYAELWEDYIKPSCIKIEQKQWNEAKMIYVNMVKKLCQLYSIKVDKHIMQKYNIDIQ